MTAEQVAARFGCTPEQARAQFAANAKQLETLAARARAAGGKVRGHTASEWQAKAEEFKACAAS